jgi:membrane-associated phospholipid phosphatase
MLAVGVAHEYDDDVRNHFVNRKDAAPAGNDPNSTEQALPTAALLAGTWVAAALTKDKAGYQESWSMAEAGALSAVSGFAMKYAFGRERPNDTARVDDWFGSGDSFPSLHTTVAFAVGTVLAESGNDRYRWVRRALGYGVAGGTAYLRMRDNVHWLSDTVAGAALGVASAHFVMNRRDHDRRSTGNVMLMPLNDGVMLSWSTTLH